MNSEKKDKNKEGPLAHRPRDMSDIESILDVHLNLDVERIERWVSEFSSALDMPEIMRDMESLLSKYRIRNKITH